MQFFDTTPIGQILNRFSKDVDEIDTRIPFYLEALVMYLSLILITLILITVVFYWFIIPLFIFLALYILLTSFFRRSARELKRLDNISRSPVFSHLSASVQGLSTLHAYGKTGKFVEIFETLLDKNTLAFFMYYMSFRWLAVRLDVISLGISTVTALFIVLLRDDVPAAMGGVAITYALQVTTILKQRVRFRWSGLRE
jgi:ABC-type multidrug transport system fused ATPase/permease subunit